MSQAFCQQCGTRRDDDSATQCANCGAPFAPAAADVSSDEAPTRISSGPPAAPRPEDQAGPEHTRPYEQQQWQQGAPQQPAPQQQPYQQPGQPHGQQQPGQPYGAVPQQQSWQQGPGQHQGQQQGQFGAQQFGAPQQGEQQWGPMNQPQQKSSKAPIWIALAAVVLLIGGGVGALFGFGVIGGDDDGGDGDDKGSSASDEEQIEQVVTDYNDALQSVLDGDTSACDDIGDLVVDFPESDRAACQQEATPDSGVTFEITFKSAEVDGDEATAQVSVATALTEGTEPATDDDEMQLRKVDGDWRIDLEATSSSEPSELPSFDPSDLPSFDPSDLPSFDPSDLPSFDPSDLPSFDPSDLPTIPEPSFTTN